MSIVKVIPIIKISLSISMKILLTLVIMLLVVDSAGAQEIMIAPGRNVSTVSFLGQGPVDPVEVEAFMDEIMVKQMEEKHIVGAAVSVVKNGKVVFAKGYGYADLENKIPVVAEKTLFKIGSVTKLFTWTAVMQLVEQGKLDLDADINTYLDFRIQDTYPQPITLKHLMTHTAGFEDQHVDMVAWKEEDLAPQREWLVSHIPARVRPPGEAPAYSNYGAALAGYIVARVSGESYSQYVQEYILNPLGMKNTTAYWPTPPELHEHESLGYRYEDGTFKLFPSFFSQVDLYPAGIVRATVTDMARFMIAHLQGGFYGDAAAEVRILEEATARQMHRTLYTPDSRILGNAYGFFEFNDNGQRVIGHSGEGEPMHSLLLLLPDQNLGVFVVYNSDGAGALVNQHLGFQRAFFDHYYPAPTFQPIQPPADFAAQADGFVGIYRWTRSSSTTMEKYTTQLFAPTVEVKNPGNGTLFMTTPYGNMQLVEIDPLYFQQVDGQFHFVFRQDSQGHISYMFTDMIPQFAFEKEQWYETVGFNMPLLLVSLLMFLSMLAVASIHAIRNRRTKGEKSFRWHGDQTACQLIVWISALNLLFVTGTFVWGPWVMFGIPLAYKILMGLGVLSALLTVGALIYVVMAWKNHYWSLAFRSYYTLVNIAAFAFVWFLNYWNLLGWRY